MSEMERFSISEQQLKHTNANLKISLYVLCSYKNKFRSPNPKDSQIIYV